MPSQIKVYLYCILLLSLVLKWITAYQMIAYLKIELATIVTCFCQCQQNARVLSCSTEAKKQRKQTIAGKSPNFPMLILKLWNLLRICSSMNGQVWAQWQWIILLTHHIKVSIIILISTVIYVRVSTPRTSYTKDQICQEVLISEIPFAFNFLPYFTCFGYG